MSSSSTESVSFIHSVNKCVLSLSLNKVIAVYEIIDLRKFSGFVYFLLNIQHLRKKRRSGEEECGRAYRRGHRACGPLSFTLSPQGAYATEEAPKQLVGMRSWPPLPLAAPVLV